MNDLFGNSFLMVQKSMDYLWKKQEVIADNIANGDTPGFKARYITFEDSLKNKVERAGSMGGNASLQMKRAIEDSRSTLHETNSESARLDENNVQVEAEYIEQARSVLQYQYQIQALNSDIKQLATAIKG